MNKYLKLSCFVTLALSAILFSTGIYAQALTANTAQLNFPAAYENAPDSLQITLFNNSGKTVNVTGIKFYNTYGTPAFSVNQNSFSIADGSSNTIWVKFSPTHNIYHNSEMVVENDGLRGFLNIDLVGQGKFSNTYYDATDNLTEENLKTALKNLLALNYTSLLYNPGRDSLFMRIDNKRVNGQGAAQNTVECVYTGIEAVGFIDRTDCQTTFGFNTEHTFPQSLFSSLEPQRSDLHHLFPVDDNANTQRSDKPFGIVTNPSWSQGGSLSNSTTFEPRNEQKGISARAMLYFVTRYQNYNNFLTGQESILRLWSSNFPPDQIEKKRNDDVFQLQHNRNPYIDYPQFLDRINSISGISTAPAVPSFDLTQDTIVYGYVQQGFSNVFHFVIVNNGNVPVNFINFNLSNPGILNFQSGGNDATLQPGESLTMDINCVTSSANALQGQLTFNTDVAGHVSVSVPIFVNDPVFNSINEFTVSTFSLFPNPVKDYLTIQFDDNSRCRYSILLTDITGRLVNSFSPVSNAGLYTINISAMNSGLYFLKVENLSTGNFEYKQVIKY